MLTMDDMRFFIEPAVDQSVNTGKLFVLDTFRESYQEQYIGKVIDVLPSRYETRGRNWWTSQTGDYVFGAAVHTERRGIPTNRRLIAPFGDGFVMGTIADNGEAGMILNVARHSTATMLSLSSSRYVYVEWAVEAAPWSAEFMPIGSDTEESIAAKLELAKESYRQRRAFNYLHEQSIARGWQSDMKDVREKNDLIPDAAYTLAVTANILVPMPSSVVGTVLLEAMAARAETALERDNISTATGRTSEGMGVMVQRQFNVPHRFPSQAAVETEKHEIVRRFWRDNIGVGRLVDFTNTTSLAGLAS